MHLKLAELNRCTQGAHNAPLDLEEDELTEFRRRYIRRATRARGASQG